MHRRLSRSHSDTDPRILFYDTLAGGKFNSSGENRGRFLLQLRLFFSVPFSRVSSSLDKLTEASDSPSLGENNQTKQTNTPNL